MEVVQTSSIKPKEQSNKEDTEPINANDDEHNFDEGKGIIKIEIEELNLENIENFTAEEMEKKLHDMNKKCSLQMLQLEIDRAKTLMKSDKKNKKLYENVKKLESQYEKIKNELDSGKLTDELVLEDMKKESECNNALERTDECPEEDNGRIRKRSEIPDSEIKEIEEKEDISVIYVGTNKDENSVIPETFLAEEEIKINIERVNKEQYDEIIRRKKEYESGLEYLLNNGFISEYENLLGKMKMFNASLITLNKRGRIPVNQMPPKLTPQILFNTTIEKRKASYTELTKLLHDDKTFFQDQIKKSHQEDSELISNYTNRVKEISHLMSIIMNNQRNPWIPCPLYRKETNTVEVNAIQRDIKEGEVVIEYFPSHNLEQNKNYFVLYELRGRSGIFKGEFSGSKWGKVKIQLPKRDRNIHEHEFSFKLQERQCLFCCTPIRGKIETKLSDLEGASTAVYKQSGDKSFDVVVKIRAPCNGSNTELIEREEVVIDKIYPGFGEVVQPSRPIRPPDNTSIEEHKEIVQSNLEERNTIERDQPSPEVLENLPKGVKDADIQDPDNVDNLVCVSYLEERIKVLNSRMMKLVEEGKKVPDVAKNKVNLMVTNLSLLKADIENGKLSIEQYKESLERQLEKDKALLEYFVKHNEDTKAETVRGRIECINRELSSFN